MKTAVSVPDQLFKSADKLAKKLGVSRSELYSRALANLIKEQDGEKITARLNKVHSKPQPVDPFLQRSARRTAERNPW